MPPTYYVYHVGFTMNVFYPVTRELRNTKAYKGGLKPCLLKEGVKESGFSLSEWAYLSSPRNRYGTPFLLTKITSRP
jgi:hypothetical protein